MIFLKKYFVNTTAGIDILSVSADVRYAVRDAKASDGLVTVVVPGPGAGLILLEPLPELIDQFKTALAIYPGEGIETLTRRKEPVAVGPRIKGAILGRQVSLPLVRGEIVLAPREEVMLVDVETTGARREYVIQVLHELPPEVKSPAVGKKPLEVKR